MAYITLTLSVDHAHTIVFKTVYFRRWIVWYLYAKNADNTILNSISIRFHT